MTTDRPNGRDAAPDASIPDDDVTGGDESDAAARPDARPDAPPPDEEWVPTEEEDAAADLDATDAAIATGDAALDAARDASPDAASDAARDASPDATPDAGPRDSGPDAAACVPGVACTPAGGNPCKTGLTACTASGTVCQESNRSNGTTCGSNMVCNGGTCAACTASAACTPTNACKNGAITCASGSPVCVATTNRSNGTTCGSNMVCNGGTCAACTENAACTPSSACKNGSVTCASGSPVCVATTSRANGTTCGTDQVCHGGACNHCAAGTCVPSSNPCAMGFTDCSSGLASCLEMPGMAVPDGTPCPAGTCTGGTCVPAAPHCGSQTCGGPEVCVNTSLYGDRCCQWDGYNACYAYSCSSQPGTFCTEENGTRYCCR